MKNIIYIIVGVFFGVVLYKSEAASWYRIYEMFQFKSFHMYGIIGSAVVLGILVVQLIKRNKLKAYNGSDIVFCPKECSYSRYIYGGILFGLGWALVGACPGPMFTLLGAGYIPILIVIVSSIAGTFLYGKLRSRLPH